MNRKDFIQQLITTYKTNCEHMPSDLKQKLQEIEEKLLQLSEDEVEENMTSVVTTPAEEKPYQPDKLSFLLYEAFPLMEKTAKEAEENQYELLQATNQLRGELGMATDPPFPE